MTTCFLCGGTLKAWLKTDKGGPCTTLVACTSDIAKETILSEDARRNTSGGAMTMNLHCISSKRANYTVHSHDMPTD
jgi:hypothetical protein